MIVLSYDIVLFITSLLLWPYSLYLIIEGLHIIRGRQNIILLHYRLLFWLLKLIRGGKYMRIRRNRFTNSSEYKRHGWWGLYAGILMCAATTLNIFDFLLTIR
jgi:hypothetical protein